ncbi:MAG: NAD-dependent epimerase/dehydratase family protein [Candidatus Eremiobacterota bacterium]
MPVLVTGAGGFLGSLLCRRLLALDARVHCLVRSDRAYPRLEGLPVQRVPLDDPFANRPAVAFHLAGSLNRSRTAEAALECWRENLQFTARLLESASGRCATVVCAGTGDEYGDGPVPFCEDQALAPLTPYAASKAAAGLWSLAAGPCLGLNVVWARLFLQYGPGQRSDFFLAQLLASSAEQVPLDMTPGAQTRDFTWAEDSVESLVRLGASPVAAGRAFNVCTGVETRLRDAVELAQEVAGRRIPVNLGALPYREGEIFRLFGRPDRLRETVGYAPSTTLREGLERLIR